MRLLRWLAAFMLLLVACADDSEAPVSLDDYTAAWAAAWSGGDPYDIVRFYDPDVEIDLAQGDNELQYAAGYVQDTTSGRGTAWLASWIEPQTEPHDWRIESLVLDERRAIVMVAIDDLESAAAFELEFGDDGIAGQTTLRWRDAHKENGEPDARLDWVELVIGDYMGRWLEEGSGPLASPRLLNIETGVREGRAWFVTPGAVTTRLVFFVKTAECTVAVRLGLQEREVVDDRRLLDSGCRAVPAPWEAGLAIPGDLEDEPSGRLGDIELYSGSSELAELVAWGLQQFEAAGLGVPVVDSVTFAPSRSCEGLSGLTLDSPRSRELLLCTDAYSACEPDRDTCTSFNISARFALLHELAHAWLLDNTDDDVHDAFMEFAGLDTWNDAAVPWFERGVEHAAEIVAWGVMVETLDLARIGSPTCGAAKEGFTLLTGVAAVARECG